MSPYGDDLGVVLHAPDERHVCSPPMVDRLMRPPPGPATWPSMDHVRALLAAGCTHYVITSDVSARAGEPWETPCPVHPWRKPTKVGEEPDAPLGTLWRCHDCGTVWICDNRRRVPDYYGGGYVAGSGPYWRRATRRERNVVRASLRARLIARLRR